MEIFPNFKSSAIFTTGPSPSDTRKTNIWCWWTRTGQICSIYRGEQINILHFWPLPTTSSLAWQMRVWSNLSWQRCSLSTASLWRMVSSFWRVGEPWARLCSIWQSEDLRCIFITFILRNFLHRYYYLQTLQLQFSTHIILIMYKEMSL